MSPDNCTGFLTMLRFIRCLVGFRLALPDLVLGRRREARRLPIQPEIDRPDFPVSVLGEDEIRDSGRSVVFPMQEDHLVGVLLQGSCLP